MAKCREGYVTPYNRSNECPAPVLRADPRRRRRARSRRSGTAATAASWRSTATRTGSTRSAARTARPVVVKFYRPERWSDAAILEEHEFALELARAEIPVVAPDVHDGRSPLRARRVPLRGLSAGRAGAGPNSAPRTTASGWGASWRASTRSGARARFAIDRASTGACWGRRRPTTCSTRGGFRRTSRWPTNRWPTTC